MNILRHRLINSVLVEAVGAESLCTRNLTLLPKYKLFSFPGRAYMRYLTQLRNKNQSFFSEGKLLDIWCYFMIQSK